MSNFPSKLRVFDVSSDEFVVEGHFQHFLQNPEKLPDLSESRYEISWMTGWSDLNGEDLWERDVVKRVRDKRAERELRDYQENGLPGTDEKDASISVEDYVRDYSGGIAVIEWRDGGFVFDQLSGHKWSFYDPQGSHDFDFDEIEKFGSIHQRDINSVIDKHKDAVS